MKIVKQLFLFALFLLSLGSCRSRSQEQMIELINDRLDKATQMYTEMAESLLQDSTLLPRSFEDNKLVTSNSRWWCSGFFPGSLWYLYENNPSPKLKEYAMNYTERDRREQFTTDNHDIGFMIFCSFGNGFRLTGMPAYKQVIEQAAQSLSTRYKQKVGLIRSWDWNNSVWQYPVIIDNMMNLELLMWTARESNRQDYAKIALSHADKTMKEHFRADYSCYHLVDYDSISGNPRIKQTVQGYADESAWARGQAWALYGYTMMYRESGRKEYLRQAEQVAKFILGHPNLPEDKIPYWDFNAPDIPNAKRDASAAAIIASASIELSRLTADARLGKELMAMAEMQIKVLSSPEYFANVGTNGNFILKHSVGSLPGNSEIDVPLSYADYYYIEAMMRYKKIFGKE